MNFFSNVLDYWQPLLINWVTVGIRSIVVMIAGWWIINRICAVSVVFFRKGISDSGIISFLDSFVRFFLRVILIIIVLGYAGFNVTSLFAAIGASLVAIGISLKDNISNLVSGIILVVTKPIHVGDYIEFEGSKGTVIKIEMLVTTLQAEEEGKTVIIPNSRLVSNNITRKSEYNIELMEIEYESSIFTKRYTEFVKYMEKEFFLNNKVLKIPVPVIEVELKEENKIIINIKVWVQKQYIISVKNDIEKYVQKLSKKYGVNFHLNDLN